MMRGTFSGIVGRAVAATIVCAALVSAGQNLTPTDPAAAAAARPVRVADVSYDLGDRPGRLAGVKLTVEGAPSGVSVRLRPSGRWLSCKGNGPRWICPMGLALKRVKEVSVRFSD